MQVTLEFDSVAYIVNDDALCRPVRGSFQDLAKRLLKFFRGWIVEPLQLARTKVLVKVCNFICFLSYICKLVLTILP